MTQLSNTYECENIKEIRESRVAHDAPLRFYAELFIEHSLSDVWSFFSDLAKWRRWSPICHGCRMIDNGPLRRDCVLEMRLKVAGITVTVPARVMQFDPPESITWQGQGFGIHATHNYRFIPRNEGTLMCNEETFTGVGFPLSALISAWYRASKVGEASLQGIRRELLGTIGLARAGARVRL